MKMNAVSETSLAGCKRLRQMSIADSFKRAKTNSSFSCKKSSTMDTSQNGQDVIIDIGSLDECMDSNGENEEQRSRQENGDHSRSNRVGETSDTASRHVESQASTRSSDKTASSALFSEDSGVSVSQGSDQPTELNLSLGFALRNFKRIPECLPSFVPLTVDDSEHTVLFRPHFRKSEAPRPFPETYRDKWDNNHVRMPCSPENLYPIADEHGGKKLHKRWNIIKNALQKPIKSSLDLEEAIMKYNSQYKNKWDFTGLHYFFTEVLSTNAIQYFFAKLLPKMVKLALELPQICTQPVPLLRRQNAHAITLSQKGISCLLANAFFCTFPRRNAQRSQSEYATFPEINFSGLFVGSKDGQNPRIGEKLKCLLNYFQRVTSKEPDGCVTFKRRALTTFPDWENDDTLLREYHVKSEGTIEDDGVGMLQIDFANKYVGGGVLRSGCVQEEIRFVVCPELLVSRLFTEVLDANECLIITGCEQFCKYTGYSDNFQWEQNYVDPAPRDPWNRICTEIVAMDATHFRSPRDQYIPKWLKREANKAYCGFYGDGQAPEHLPAIATGNWGCGAFRGAPHLKSLLQFMAASVAGRDMLYFTFHNTSLCEEIHDMFSFLKERNVTVGEIWKILVKYCDTFPASAKRPKVGLFVYIRKVLDAYDTNTDSDGDEGKQEEKRENRRQQAQLAEEDFIENNEDDLLISLYLNSE